MKRKCVCVGGGGGLGIGTEGEKDRKRKSKDMKAKKKAGGKESIPKGNDSEREGNLERRQEKERTAK